MKHYGSGGSATAEKNAAGFRLLAVSNKARGLGLGKILTMECIEKAKTMNLQQVIIHTTNAMKPAWDMYEKIGFRRSEDLDFKQGNLEVFGFRYQL
jgi:ribosomal protein S18 acetylase RimI-like enzyme